MSSTSLRVSLSCSQDRASHPEYLHWHKRHLGSLHPHHSSYTYYIKLKQNRRSLNCTFTTSSGVRAAGDPICELSSSTLRYGPNATSEVGHDLAISNANRILLFVDPHVRSLDPFNVVMNSIDQHQVSKTNTKKDIVVDIYDQIRVEPNNISFQHAIQFMQDKISHFGPYDAIIALGGGSTIDTAKAANLYACCPPLSGDFYDYVNPPLGKGMPVPLQSYLTPLIAIPTTAGTGSETTSVAIFDDIPTRSKTGIANKRLRPTLGIVDPNNMRTLPSSVAKYSGMDVLCHALESYTAIPHWLRPIPYTSTPMNRPAYQGSNPISDIWSLHALRECATYLPRMVKDPTGDEEARSKMCLASTSAGNGFGNAGVHLCHGMSYAVASQVKDGYWTEGYEKLNRDTDFETIENCDEHGLVAHGLSVAINSPAVFRFTGKPNQIKELPAEKYSQDRHTECALILHNARVQRNIIDNTSSIITTISEKAIRQHPGEALADELLELMLELKIPVGLRSLGYNEFDVLSLARATLPQHRVTKLSPRQPIELEELQGLFIDAL